MHWSTGNTFMCVAIIQSMIEFNIFMPKTNSSLSRWSKVKTFESFWKSNLPLIGDEGALGWSEHLQNSEASVGFGGLENVSMVAEPMYEHPVKLLPEKEVGNA